MLSKNFVIELNTTTAQGRNTDIVVNQGDVRSVVFDFRVKDGVNEVEYSLVSAAVLFAMKPDKTLVQQALTAKEGGGYTVVLSQQALAMPGRVVAGVVLYGHDSAALVTLNFVFMVERSLAGGVDIESENDFDVLQQMMAQLNDLIAQVGSLPATNHALMHNLGFAESGHTGFETTANKVELSENATGEQYPTAKSTWDAMQQVVATIPVGGLRIPVQIALESELPDPVVLTAENVGDHWKVQDMDVTAEGRTGMAWVNYQNSNPANPIVIYKTYDRYYSADGESIVLTPAGRLSVSAAWLSEHLSGLRNRVQELETGFADNVEGVIFPNGFDLNSFVKTGRGGVTTSAGVPTILNRPSGTSTDAFTVENYTNPGQDAGVQFYRQWRPSRVWYRGFTATNPANVIWNEWESMPLESQTTIPLQRRGMDMDTIRWSTPQQQLIPGFSGSSADANNWTISTRLFMMNAVNTPTPHGTLEVTWFDGTNFIPAAPANGGIVWQKWTQDQGSGANTFVRERRNFVWGAWRRITIDTPQETLEPVLINGWSVFPTDALHQHRPTIRRSFSGTVTISGRYQRTAGMWQGAMFTLPAGYRPTSTIVISAEVRPTATTFAYIPLHIETNGVVTPLPNNIVAGAFTQMTFSVSFPAAV